MTPTSPALRFLAFYLPQFHPIPENDAWWGTGFTEWRNVAAARPAFRGHDQPHVPADLGFYDLRIPEVREAQADLAKAHGIDGFVYYHYWFNGRRLLERPFDEVLASGSPDLPFALCWANENWTRVWDGSAREVLLAQEHSEADDRAHLRSLVPALRDERYIRVDGRPLLMVYRTGLLPDPRRTAAAWRDEARRAGLGDLYLARVEALGEKADPAELGFDAAIEFAPDAADVPAHLGDSRVWEPLRKHGLAPGRLRHHVVPYAGVVERLSTRARPEYLRYPCVTPSWDNSARRKHSALVLQGSTPEQYGAWLAKTCERFEPPSATENVVFVNAWNEWAEGNHLEPDQRWGKAYLEAHREVAQRYRG